MTSLGEDGLLKGASPAAQTNAAKLKWKEERGLADASCVLSLLSPSILSESRSEI